MKPLIFFVVVLTMAGIENAVAQSYRSLNSEPVEKGWTRYENGFRVELPNIFKTHYLDTFGNWWFETPPTADSSRIYVEIEFVSSWNSYKKEFKHIFLTSDDSVIRSQFQKDYCDALVVGEDEYGQTYFYYKVVRSQKNAYELIIRYDSNDKPIVEPIMPRIAASFH
jgi:hypothetical protein